MSEMIHVRGSLCAIEEITAQNRVQDGSMDALLCRMDTIVAGYKKAIAVEANSKADFYLVLTIDLPRAEIIDPAELEKK